MCIAQLSSKSRAAVGFFGVIANASPRLIAAVAADGRMDLDGRPVVK